MNYKRLFPLLLLCVKTAISASDKVVIPGSSAELQGDMLVNAVRTGTQEQYEQALAKVKYPAKKVAFYCPARERIARILPIRACIDAVFDRESADSVSLIAAVDEHIVQRAPQVLQQPCFRKQLPFAYAYDKLTDGYWLEREEPFVAPLFTLLAGNAQSDCRLLALQLTCQDKRWYATAIKTIRQHPTVLTNLYHALMALDQPSLAQIMLRHEPLKSTVGEVAVQLTALVNPEVAYNHMCQLLAIENEESLNQKQSNRIDDLQEAKNRLLFWAAAHPVLPTKFFTQLLKQKADPYALMAIKCPRTPIEQALATAMDTQHDHSANFYAINRLQAMLNVSELDSAQCQLLIDPDGEYYWAEEVYGRMQYMLGKKFKECGMEPFLAHLSLWNNIVTSLGADMKTQRCMVYSFVTKKNYHGLLQGSSFEQFCRALQVQNFCSLVAQNLTDNTVATDLHAFLKFGIEKHQFDPLAIMANKEYTHTIVATLAPEARAQIDLLIEQNKSA